MPASSAWCVRHGDPDEDGGLAVLGRRAGRRADRRGGGPDPGPAHAPAERRLLRPGHLRLLGAGRPDDPQLAATDRRALGLSGIPDPVLFGFVLYRYPPSPYWYLVLALAGGVALGSRVPGADLARGSMVAVGDDPVLAQSVGIDANAVKVAAFTLSAGVGGLAGSFGAIYYKYLSHVDFTLNLSIQVLAIVVLANSRRFLAVAISAIVLAPLGESLRMGLRGLGVAENARFVFYGVVLVVIVVARARLGGPDRDAEPALKADRLSIRFGACSAERRLVRGRAGEVMAVFGGNGSGRRRCSMPSAASCRPAATSISKAAE